MLTNKRSKNTKQTIISKVANTENTVFVTVY